jgi:hypothetical protein
MLWLSLPLLLSPLLDSDVWLRLYRLELSTDMKPDDFFQLSFLLLSEAFDSDPSLRPSLPLLSALFESDPLLLMSQSLPLSPPLASDPVLPFPLPFLELSDTDDSDTPEHLPLLSGTLLDPVSDPWHVLMDSVLRDSEAGNSPLVSAEPRDVLETDSPAGLLCFNAWVFLARLPILSAGSRLFPWTSASARFRIFFI